MQNMSGGSNPGEEKIEIPEVLPIIFLSEETAKVFPLLVIPLKIPSDYNLELIKNANLKENQSLVGVVSLKPPDQDGKRESYKIGCAALFLQLGEVSEKEIGIALRGVKRIEIKEYIQTEPYRLARIEVLSEESIEEDKEIRELKRSLRSGVQKIAQSRPLPPMQLQQLLMEENPGFLADMFAIYFLTGEEEQEILETLDVKQRLQKAVSYQEKVIIEASIDQEIDSKIDEDAQEMMRKDYLRRRLKAIQEQLGEDGEESEEIEELKKKILEAKMPEYAEKKCLDELEKMSKMSEGNPNRQVIRTWVETMIKLPWNVSTTDELDIKKARRILEEDHYDLEEVRKRVLDFLAVRKLRTEKNIGNGSPTLCFIGPPGTGKTSIGKSIARAMGRKFVYTALGGVHDEAEIRGHRSTYVGALPGRIIAKMIEAGSNNPVFMIDEIEKIGTSALHGDPSSALLEVLDPERNNKFEDTYLAMPFDLSNVMFICTGNTTDTILPALLDRMEKLDFPGYTSEERLEIAKRFLVPRQLKENGLEPDQLQFNDEAINSIVQDYTREVGVRILEQVIGSVCRGVATQIAEGEISQEHIDSEEKLFKHLGPKRVLVTTAEEITQPGIAIGLSVTPVGGEILFFEATVIKDLREELELTGQQGEVMRESARIARTYVQANQDALGIKKGAYPPKSKTSIHAWPGAVPKEGPSAGLPILAALVSCLTGKKVKKDVAMTGEITSKGKVLPVGGIKEKLLAAKRAGIKTVVLPERNRKDLQDLYFPKSLTEAIVRGDIKIKFVKEAKEALEIVLES